MLENFTIIGLWLQRLDKIGAAFYKRYDKVYDPQYANIFLKIVKSITRHYFFFLVVIISVLLVLIVALIHYMVAMTIRGEDALEK